MASTTARLTAGFRESSRSAPATASQNLDEHGDRQVQGCKSGATGFTGVRA